MMPTNRTKPGRDNVKGKIIKGIAGFYYVHVVESGVYECKAKGIFRKEKTKPLVGDNVEIEIIDEQNKKAIIENIIERKNFSRRPKVANLTGLICVIATKLPKPDLLMLDKQLAFAEYYSIKPTIIVNKIDKVILYFGGFGSSVPFLFLIIVSK